MKLIKRQLYQKLVDHFKAKEISLIVGPRQAGKTTLMMLLREEITKLGKQSIFFNLDIEADKQYFSSQDQLVRKIKLELGDSPGFIFIDEIQRKENAGLFLKGLYDMNLPYKLIVSGSGSVELKEKIHESLAGRKRVFALSTLNLVEFINFKTDYRYEGRLVNFFDLEREQLKQLFEEYLNYGGYPRVVLAKSLEEKRQVIAELYQSYLERDVANLLGVVKTESFTTLLRLMASQIGNLVNMAELSSTLGVSVQTVKDYLWYLQKTYILDKVTPYFRNVRKEITKAPVFYFKDLGLRNFALQSFGNLIPDTERGFLFQNFIYHLLKEKVQNTSFQIHFWRTTSKAEVDFVVNKGMEVVPVEVKYKQITALEMTRSFQSFLSQYRPKHGYVIHLGERSKKVIGESSIDFVPYQQFVLEGL